LANVPLNDPTAVRAAAAMTISGMSKGSLMMTEAGAGT
jgi:hypothetical protein